MLRAFAGSAVAVPSVGVLGAWQAAWTAAAQARDPSGDMTARGFADPTLELVRLLRNAADIEHASLLQYLYAAFSLKPEYESISGYYSDDAISLLSIAIDRMMRLGAANRMLGAIGAPPRLTPPPFPFHGDPSRLALDLTPLSRASVAQFIYREAPPEMFDGAAAASPDTALVAAVCTTLGVAAKPAASIYPVIEAVAGEINRTPGTGLPDLSRWIGAFRLLETRGRDARLTFLGELFRGSHAALAAHGDVWRLPTSDPAYPAHAIERSRTAASDLVSQPSDPTTLALARLGNLQYGTMLLLLDLHFRSHLPVYRSLAVTHMMGPVRSIGKHLPLLGAGMPFEAIDVPDASALNARHRLRFVMALQQEGQNAAEAIGSQLPSDYPRALNRDTMAKLRELEANGATDTPRLQ